MQTYDQPTPQPTNKVIASGVGGALAVIVVWLLSTFGVQVPPEVAAAIATILAFIGGYVTRERVV